MSESEMISAARRYAEWALLDRLTLSGEPAKNALLKARIAGIRAGTHDTAPEVQSALYAIRFTIHPEVAARS